MRQVLAAVSCALVLMVASSADAQSTFATLVGSIADGTGGVLPGVTITTTNVGTQAVRTATTDAVGNYQVANLDAGRYRVTIVLAGFVEFQQDVELLARQTVRVDARLAVAGGQERVEVRATAPLIQTENATIDTSKSGEEISRLALNFRASNATSPIVVATLAQGVQQDRAGELSIAGMLPFMTSFSIDGISSQRTRAGGPSREMFPSVESIEEFKVSSANNNAEFMQVTDITTTSRSGTNNLHGSVFWFLQDSALSSTDRFNPRDANGKAIKPDVQANSFGLSVGGPIRRNRTFLFGTFEGVRRPNEVTLSQVVPPDAWRSGDLSSFSRQIRNPFTGQPYPSNQVPVNAAAARVLDQLYERQNQATGPAVDRPNYVVNFPGDFTVNGFDVRGDQILTPSQKVFARFSYKDTELTGPQPANANWNTRQGEFFSKTEVRQLAGNHNWVANSHLLNELRGGFSYTLESSGYPRAAEGGSIMQSIGFAGLPPTPASGGLPSFDFGGDSPFITTGGAKPRAILSRTVQLNDNLTWIKGRHSMKTGFDLQYVEYKDQVTFFEGEEFGRYSFNGSFSGNSFADFLLGLPAFTSYALNAPDGNPYAYHWAFFAQDDWRLGSKLTLNFGVRYDLRPPMTDRSNQLGNFDRDFPGGRVVVSNQEALAQVPASIRQAVPNTPFVTAQDVGLPDSLVVTDKNNINPRLGVAYRPSENNRTVIRGGVGWYTVPIYGATNYSLLGVVTSDVPLFPNRRLPDGSYAIQFPNVFPQGLRAPGSNDFRRANQWDLQNPRIVQWTATVERDLGWSTGLRISYVGSRTRDIVYSPDLNQIQANTDGYEASRHTRPFPDWNVVTTRDNGARADYHALGVEVAKRLRSGLSFTNSYTLARNESDAMGAAPSNFTGENGATVLDLYRGDADYGNVPFTRRHRFVSTFLWELPIGRGRVFASQMNRVLDAFVGGWDLTGITLLQSGPFLTPFFTSGADPSGTGTLTRGFTSTQRPDQTGGDGNLSDPTADAWFDRSAFVVPASNIGRFGNAPVGELVGPGTAVFSLTVGKNVIAGSTSRARLEVAFANLLNIENLDIPGNLNVTSATFGRITRTQSVDQAGPRTVQFSLRYTF